LENCYQKLFERDCASGIKGLGNTMQKIRKERKDIGFSHVQNIINACGALS
jgi:hypothetical protein